MHALLNFDSVSLGQGVDILRDFNVQVRDAWLLQCEKDRRHFGSKEELDHVSAVIGLITNHFLPKSVQLNEAKLMSRFGKQRGLAKRELQKRLTAAWTTIGFPEGAKLATWPLNQAARGRLLQGLKEKRAG